MTGRSVGVRETDYQYSPWLVTAMASMIGVLGTTMRYVLQKWGLGKSVLFTWQGNRVSGSGQSGSPGQG